MLVGLVGHRRPGEFIAFFAAKLLILSLKRQLDGIVMTTVKCPICKTRVSGATSTDLNEELKIHLAEVHNMRELAMAKREGYPERQPYQQTTVADRPLERERYEVRGDVPRGYVERRPSHDVFNEPASRTYREVETWTSRDPARFDDRNYIPREEVRQWRYPVTSPTGERGPVSDRYWDDRGTAVRREEERYRTTEKVVDMTELNCPLCGRVVRGRDEEELSDELRDHMFGVHDIRETMITRTAGV
jgi:predicted small metal-binding protein